MKEDNYNRLQTYRRKSMSETSFSVKRPDSAAGSTGAKPLLLALATVWILLILAMAVVLLRLFQLTENPPGFFIDEGAHGLDALRVLQGEHAVFFPGNQGREGLVVYAIALSISSFGRTALAIRLPTALASASTVFVVFWLGQLLFGRDENGRAKPWRGLLIAGVGAGLLAVSLNWTILGRIAFRANFLPLLLCLCLALLWSGWRQRIWWQIALAGVCAGLLPYTYIAARFTPILFLFFGLSFLFPLGYISKQRIRTALPRLGVFVGVAGLIAAPIFIFFALQPDLFVMRSKDLWIFSPTLSQGTPLRALLGNVWEHLLAFGFHGDQNWRHNFAGQPVLNPWEAFFFWLGAGMGMWRWRRKPAYRLLLLWLGVMLLPAMLAKGGFPGPNTLRMMGAAPAIYLLIGVGMWEVFQFIGARRRASKFFLENEVRIAMTLGAAVSGLIILQGIATYHTYFREWASAPETHRSHGAEWKDLARVMNAQASAADTVYLLPQAGSSEHYGFEYLYSGATPARIIDSILPTLPQETRATLSSMEHLSTVKVVDWITDPLWAENGGKNIIALLSKYGRYVDSDEFTNFRIHTYTDLALDRPWTFYETLEPLAVYYDGGIDLRGLALGKGEEQLSSQQLVSLEQARSLWMGLQWRTTPGLDTDFAISLRLYNSEGALSFQRDAVLGNRNHARTSLWSAEEAVDTLFHLDFSDDLQPGEYELRLIVYDAETLTPTVEIDVWQPETTLARLRFESRR